MTQNVFGYTNLNKTEYTPFQVYEKQLIDILRKDTSSELTLELDSKVFNFGVSNNNKYTNLHVIKHGKEIYIQLLGTGELYSVKNNPNGYHLERIDETYHSGASFFCNNFFLRDTLFQFGGIGFWSMRGFFTFFSPQTNQWEMYQSNRQVLNYYDNQRFDILKFLVRDNNNPKYYTTNSYAFSNFPFTFDIISSDTTFVFEFNKKEWNALGKTTLEFKKLTQYISLFDFYYDKYLIIQSGLDFYWIDFENNQFGRLNNQKNSYLRQRWLNMYNKEAKESLYNFQFSLNDNEIYFSRIGLNKEITSNIVSISKEDFDLTTAKPIYITNKSLFGKYSALLYKFAWPFLLISLLIIGYYIYINNNNRKKNIPKKVNEILNSNFFLSLNIVEKELIETLLDHAKKSEFVSTKQINKIIGVQHKDVITQNKSRSDYFIKINQKYKLATQQEEPLIIKERDKDDKRQYNYSIHSNYIKDIESLLKA
jgi:hypothetical protein